MIDVLIVNPNGTAHIEGVQNVYPALNQAMGVEYIQALYTPGLVYYMDEESKFNQWATQPNPYAEEFYRSRGGRLLPGDYFVGPVAIVSSEKAPEDYSTPQWVIDKILEMGLSVTHNEEEK